MEHQRRRGRRGTRLLGYQRQRVLRAARAMVSWPSSCRHGYCPSCCHQSGRSVCAEWRKREREVSENPPQILEAKASSRTSHVAEEVLRQTGYGILSNDGVTPQSLLVFVHGLVSDAVPRLSGGKPHPPPVATTMHSLAPPRRPEDSWLIPKEPGRARPKPATQTNVAAHVITEFGLQVCAHGSIRRGNWSYVCMRVCVCV